MRIKITGASVLVDPVDELIVRGGGWYFDGHYAARHPPGGGKHAQPELLHRAIIRPTGKWHVDHINGDTMDNRRANLRLVPRFMQSFNSKRRVDNYSGVVGVHKHGNGWVAIGKLNRQTVYLGYFGSIEEAAMIRLLWELDIYGEPARGSREWWNCSRHETYEATGL